MIWTPKRCEAAGDKMRMCLSLENDLPLIGHVNAGKHLDQGALAAPVLPGKAVDLRGTNREVDVLSSARTPPKRLLMPRISMKSDALSCAACPGFWRETPYLPLCAAPSRAGRDTEG